MSIEPRIDIIANAIADQTRASIVCMLMDGRAFTAKELAYGSGVTPQTASFHLHHLVRAGLISVVKSGRNRYHRLAGQDVAQLVETLATLTPPDNADRIGPRGVPEDVRLARTCYDHLAGELAVRLAETISARGFMAAENGAQTVTGKGEAAFSTLGIDVARLRTSKRPLVRECLDWTERRPHIAGELGAALLDELLARDWFRRVRNSRALTVGPLGEQGFRAVFGIEVTAAHWFAGQPASA